jgi:hypothetical protein
VSPRSQLAIYLEDHLAGSTAGLNLARRSAATTEGTRAGRTLAAVAAEIADDRDTLLRLMAALGIRGSRLKNTVAWVAERADRLKPNGRMHGEPALQRLHELEALSLGISGKLALWEALRVAPEAKAVAGVDLEALASRARSQRERVEVERIAFAAEAFSHAAAATDSGYAGSSPSQ